MIENASPELQEKSEFQVLNAFKKLLKAQERGQKQAMLLTECSKSHVYLGVNLSLLSWVYSQARLLAWL